MSSSRIWRNFTGLNQRSYRKLAIGLFVFFLLVGSSSLALAAPVVVATIPLTNEPYGAGINITTNRYYVTSVVDNTVTVIDGNTNSIVTTIPMAPNGMRPQGVVANPNNNRVYIANLESASVTVIDGTTNTVITNITGILSPSALDINPVTNRIYVSQYNLNKVAVIDGATNTVINSYNVGLEPQQSIVNPVTNRVYTYNGFDNNITVYDANTNTLNTLPFSGGISVDSINNKLYIASSTRIIVLDGNTHAILNNIDLGVLIWEAIVNPSTNLLYVTATYSNRVIVLNATSYAVLGNLSVGTKPTGISVNPATNQIFVMNSGSNTISVIKDYNVLSPTISKTFGTNNILLNTSTTLTFTIHNPNAGDPLTGISFTDNLPAGLVVDLAGNVTNTCNGTPGLTATTITLNGGTLTAGTSCTLSLSVKATAEGTKNNITSPVTSTESWAGETSNTATLNVCDPLKVTSTLDNGLCGTFRYATNFLTANPNYSSKAINISLSPVPNSITLSGSNLTIPTSVTINGVCNNISKKPDIIINGSGISGPGLTLNGNNNLTGLKIKGFLGSQLHALKGGNKLKCVVSSQS